MPATNSNLSLAEQLILKDQEILALKKEVERLKGRAINYLDKIEYEISDIKRYGVLDSYNLGSLFTTNDSGYITWVNRGFELITGYTMGEVWGKRAYEVLSGPATSHSDIERIAKAYSNGVFFEAEVLYYRKDGSPLWIKVKGQPIEGFDGTLKQFVVSHEDITQSKTFEQNLVKSQEQFKDLTENVPGVVYQWREDANGKAQYTYISPKLKDIFNIDPESLSSFLMYIHPDDKEGYIRNLTQARNGNDTIMHEGRLIIPGLGVRWTRVLARRSKKDKGGITYNGILLDITAEKEAEKTLKETELVWKQALEFSGDGTWEYDCFTLTTCFSSKFLDTLKIQEGAVDTGDFIRDFIHPSDASMLETSLEELRANKRKSLNLEIQIKCHKCEWRWFLLRGTVTKATKTGIPEKIIGTITDITDIKNAQLLQEAAALRLSTTIENLQDAILLENEDRRIVLTNQAFCDIFQIPVSPAQLKGSDCSQSVEQTKHLFEDGEQFVADVDEILKARKLRLGDIVKMANGTIIQRDFVPIYVQGNYFGHLWKYTDITYKTNEETALKQSEEKYRSIIENMNLGLLEVDLNEDIKYANQSFCEISGFTSEELINRNALELFTVGNTRAFMEDKNRQRIEGKSDIYEVAVRDKGGNPKWLLISGAPLYNAAKEMIGSIGIHLDITHQKKLEFELIDAKKIAEESAKAKELFLANMSHEIRTPMNAILGMSNLLGKSSLNFQQQNYLQAIRTSAENLLVIINDILDFSKIEAGKLDIESIPFKLEEVLSQVEKIFKYKAEEKGLKLEITHAEMPVDFIGDPFRINQVLINLISNSLKFTDKGYISIHCDGDILESDQFRLKLKVKDTGIGIHPDYLKNIFNDFSQSDISVSRKYGGTGLGLSICKRLCDLMDGEVSIESGLGQGTTISISLILKLNKDASAMVRKEQPSTHSANFAGKKILLVEDNEFNRILALAMIQPYNFKVTEAENGEIALNLLKQEAFDLVLMDLQMPVMNGYETAYAIRKELKLQTPIIALTANAIKGENQKCFDAGMNDYLAKPYQEEDLLRLINKWLDNEAPVSTTATAKKPDEPIDLFDLSFLEKASAGNKTFYNKMIESFITNTTQAVGEIQECYSANDLSRLQKVAHKIKPSINYLKIQVIEKEILFLENIPENTDNQTIKTKIELVREIISKVNDALRKIQ